MTLSIWEGFGGTALHQLWQVREIKCRGARLVGDGLNASLIVMVTDKCPCNRWCCGDEPHFDLSFWGLARSAITGAGSSRRCGGQSSAGEHGKRR